MNRGSFMLFFNNEKYSSNNKYSLEARKNAIFHIILLNSQKKYKKILDSKKLVNPL